MKFRDSDRAFSMSMHKPLYSCFPFVSFTITKGSHCTGKKRETKYCAKRPNRLGRGAEESVWVRSWGLGGGSRKRDGQIGLVMERDGEMGRKRDGRWELVNGF